MRKTLFLLALTIAFISCDSDNDEPKTDFEIAKVKWENFQIKDYTIQENTSCFCTGLLEWTTKVSNKEKDTVYFDESKLYKDQTYQMVFDDAKTIDDAFEFIENFDMSKVDFFTVEYDEKYGFPKSIVIDYHIDMADDEIAYLFSNFTPSK